MTRPPALRATFDPNELVVDSFAGGGGASTGIEAALGRPVDIAINHSPQAIAMHKANHPETRHYCENIWQVDPRAACGSRPVGLAWFSPDCFPAGTMVLTTDGYRAIERIRVGDVVLTHRQRWRRVTQTHRALKPLVSLRGHGHPGLRVSPEHPFYARRRRMRHVGYTFDAATWTKALELDRGWYWSSPTSVPSLPIPPMTASAKGTGLPLDERLMWLAGRYLGDGWTRLTPRRAELVIICGRHEAVALRDQLNQWPRAGVRVKSGELAWACREVRTGYQYAANSRALVEWLRAHFGHGAANKRIPAWAFGMAVPLRRALLSGYLSADGWSGRDARGKGLVEATTVSPALAWSLRTLATTLGFAPAVYLRESQNNVIEGRTVNARPTWGIRWREEIVRGHAQTFLDEGLQWSPVRDRTRVPGKPQPVFNLAVEEDESYVADGIIVHNCTHFSRAKGNVPRSKDIRGLAWVVVRWAETVRPRVIILENVEEFQTWGPLRKDGRPHRGRVGETFRAFLATLTDLGYTLDFRTLVAADYGTPTVRKRLFLVARRDGATVVWPDGTHGAGRPRPWRPAAEIVDWSLPCPSIFDRKRPLAAATLRRIAVGVQRYVLDTAQPFIVPVTHPGDARVHGIHEPLRTVTAANRGELALVSPTLIQTSYGERKGQAPRVLDLHRPLGTVVAGGQKHGLVAAFLAKHYGGVVGHDVHRPIGTITGVDHHAVVAAVIVKNNFGSKPCSGLAEPLHTVTTQHNRFAEVRAFLTKFYGTSIGADPQLPLPTVTAGGRRGGGHLGLVMVAGEPYAIADIGMRMLQPHELFAAQGFPDTYAIAPDYNGKPLTKTAQIELAGNSVCPQVAEAIVAANGRQREEVAA